MDEDLNKNFEDDLEPSEDPKICSECEREFDGPGDKCPECESEESMEEEDKD